MNEEITINYTSKTETNSTRTETIHYGCYSDSDIIILIGLLNKCLSERKLYKYLRKENITLWQHTLNY